MNLSLAGGGVGFVVCSQSLIRLREAITTNRKETNMKTSFAIASIISAAILAGCATKTRSIDIAGMYASESGAFAIGRIEVQSAPEGVESAAIRYSEDTAWLSPSVKTHGIKIMLTGTNAVSSATGIVESICKTFTTVATTNDVYIVK